MARMRFRKTPLAVAVSAAFHLSQAHASVPGPVESQVNTFTTNSQFAPAVAADSTGSYVVVWSGYGAGDTAGIFAQRFSSDGSKQGTEFRVNTSTTGSQGSPSVAIDSDG